MSLKNGKLFSNILLAFILCAQFEKKAVDKDDIVGSKIVKMYFYPFSFFTL